MSILDHLDALSWRQAVFVAENLGIVVGYMFVAMKIAFILPVRLVTRLAAFAFFGTCALTHFEQALHTAFFRDESWGELSNEWHMLAIHTPQVIAVWVFVIMFYFDLRRLRYERGTTRPAKKEPPL